MDNRSPVVTIAPPLASMTSGSIGLESTYVCSSSLNFVSLQNGRWIRPIGMTVGAINCLRCATYDTGLPASNVEHDNAIKTLDTLIHEGVIHNSRQDWSTWDHTSDWLERAKRCVEVLREPGDLNLYSKPMLPWYSTEQTLRSYNQQFARAGWQIRRTSEGLLDTLSKHPT